MWKKDHNMSEELDQEVLAALSQHYDTMLWTVTSLWAAIIGGLFVYSRENFDPWLSAFGLALTVCAMYFAYSFRFMRRCVLNAMPEAFREVVVNKGVFKQWDAFALIFFSLIFLWSKLLIQESCQFWPIWLILSMLAASSVVWMWWCERRPETFS